MFKVGDRVEVTASGEWYDGLPGTVVETSDHDVCVEFDYGFGTHGHSGPFEDDRESCWYFGDWCSQGVEALELIDFPEDYIEDFDHYTEEDIEEPGAPVDQFEMVGYDEATFVDRLFVRSGWLYRVTSIDVRDGSASTSVVFVPFN